MNIKTTESIGLSYQFLKKSPTKVEKYIKNLRKQTYIEILQHFLKNRNKFSKVLIKLIYNLFTSAEKKFGKSKDSFYIDQIYVTKGPIIKRLFPRAKGKADTRKHRYSHIFIKLTANYGPKN